ncbi:MAG: hypothetical protein CL677_00200 [Bdellovibrionaceae bacterium]|nr:hypothetical protein [Pseudobdellovibrionaceae bacterium]
MANTSKVESEDNFFIDRFKCVSMDLGCFVSDLNLFKNIYLFKELSPDQIEELAGISSSHSVEAGKNIFLQGDEATAIFILRHGSVRIHQKTEHGEAVEIAVLGKGSHFGEMAFLDSARRSATATTIESSEVVRLTYSDLKKLIDSQSDLGLELYKAFSHFLCSRLRVTTSDLSYAKERNIAHF